MLERGLLPDFSSAALVQDETAQRMKGLRRSRGALSVETVEARPVFDGDAISDLRVEERNRAKDIIEDFMIGANGVTARYLAAKGLPRSAVSSARPNAGNGSSPSRPNTGWR